jgi:DHA1 family tetracycline resistance protein-like MFS transporter
MPALLSKEASKDEDAALVERERQIKLLFMHVSINMFVSILNFTTRTEMLNSLTGDFERTSVIMANWTGGTALLEFLLNPTLGALSDKYGRRPFMVMAPWASLVLKSWVFMNPTILSLSVEKIVCDGLRTCCGTTMTGTALSDLVSGPELAIYGAKMWSAMGAAIVSAPLIASRLTAKQTYGAAICMAGVQLFAESKYLEETLPEAQKKEFNGFVNPMSLVKLFTTSKPLKFVSLTVMLQFLVDVKIMSDPNTIFQLQTLKWTRPQSQTFTAVIGLGLLVGGKLTKQSIGSLGQHGHTTASQLTNAASAFILGLFPSALTQWLSGVMGFYGNLLTNATKSVATNLAVEAGMGKGEFSGMLANLRAAMVVLGPMLFGRLAYGIGQRSGRPGMPFVFQGVVVLAAEAMHQQAKAAIKEAAVAAAAAAEEKSS